MHPAVSVFTELPKLYSAYSIPLLYSSFSVFVSEKAPEFISLVGLLFSEGELLQSLTKLSELLMPDCSCSEVLATFGTTVLAAGTNIFLYLSAGESFSITGSFSVLNGIKRRSVAMSSITEHLIK